MTIIQVNMSTTQTEWWGAGVVFCLERGADVHTRPS